MKGSGSIHIILIYIYICNSVYIYVHMRVCVCVCSELTLNRSVATCGLKLRCYIHVDLVLWRLHCSWSDFAIYYCSCSHAEDWSYIFMRMYSCSH